MKKFDDSLVVDFSANQSTRHRLSACTYCGSTIGITRDHVIPVSWNGHGRNYDQGDTVKACTECNSTLGDAPEFSVPARAAFILNRYSVKHRKAIELPNWTDDELDGFDERLRSTIEAAIFNREFMLRRMGHLMRVASDCIVTTVRQITADHAASYMAFDEAKCCSQKSLSTFVAAYDASRERGTFNQYLSAPAYSSARISWLFDNKLPLDIDLKKYLSAVIRRRWQTRMARD